MDARRSAPAAARNRDPILAVLRRFLPEAGDVLEVASGTGEHVAFFARALPALRWMPSDVDPVARASIAAWCAGIPNVTAPIALDASVDDWPVAGAAAVVCINLVHIAPWAACEGLVHGAARVLPPDGVLYLYGPYRRGGVHTAPSNEAFDRSLRGQNPAWGVRDLEAVVAAADRVGLRAVDSVAMPANNLSVVFRRV